MAAVKPWLWSRPPKWGTWGCVWRTSSGQRFLRLLDWPSRCLLNDLSNFSFNFRAVDGCLCKDWWLPKDAYWEILQMICKRQATDFRNMALGILNGWEPQIDDPPGLTGALPCKWQLITVLRTIPILINQTWLTNRTLTLLEVISPMVGWLSNAMFHP